MLQKSDFDPMRYDIVFKLSAPEELHDSFGPLERYHTLLFDNYFKSRLFAILTKALGERIELIVIKMNTFKHICHPQEKAITQAQPLLLVCN